MHPAFATIEYGPFATAYHRAALDDDFKSALSMFLESELLPQVDERFESTSGTLQAAFDDERYCGPNSLVKDRYILDFTFHGTASEVNVKANLEFAPMLRTFQCRDRSGLYLWTARRRVEHNAKVHGIQSLCERIARREIRSAECPQCSRALTITDVPDLFDVRCPSRCFNFNFHRDPATGEFLHGHFFL
jgi:hypothetical protein